MSYHPTAEYCFPRNAVLRLQPRAAGPLIRDLVTVSGPYQSVPFSFNKGLLVIDPRYDTLPVRGPGWESKTT
jgi:hypothetical protein